MRCVLRIFMIIWAVFWLWIGLAQLISNIGAGWEAKDWFLLLLLVLIVAPAIIMWWWELAAGIVRWAILRDQALLGGAYEHMTAGEREVRGALAELRIEAAQENAESSPPPMDVFTERLAAHGACREQVGATGSGPAFDRCIERQEASLDAIRRRFSFTMGLDEPTFNAIRRWCRQEWSEDMVSRDRCERQRMAAARP